MSKTIVVTGANGQLGSCLKEIVSNYSQYKFIFTDVEELDITDSQEVEDLFKEHKPSWVINCAAYTAVDKAEGDSDTAELINATAVGIIAKASAKLGAGLVHVSTDYVFDGTATSPITEEMETNPLSIYGKTKLKGEVLAMSNPKHLIFRTSWLYSIYGSNFVKTMLEISQDSNEIDAVGDQWGSPTSAHDLAEAIMIAIKSSDKKSSGDVYGIYHYSNEGSASWALFAEEIMLLKGADCVVNHIPTSEYPTTATRPMYSLMSKRKFTTTFKTVVPEWELSLEKMMGKLELIKDQA